MDDGVTGNFRKLLFMSHDPTFRNSGLASSSGVIYGGHKGHAAFYIVAAAFYKVATFIKLLD